MRILIHFISIAIFSLFQLNEEASKLFEAFFVTKYSIFSAQENLRTILMEPTTKGKEVDSNKELKVVSSLTMVSLLLEAVNPICQRKVVENNELARA